MIGVKQAYKLAEEAILDSYSTLEEISLWKKFTQTKDHKIMNYFACKYMPLAMKLTNHFFSTYDKSRLISKEDVEIIASESLTEVIDKYDNLKIKFSTFAYKKICNRIRKHLSDEMELSVHYNRKQKKVKEFVKKFFIKEYREPSPDEIKKEFGFDRKEWLNLQDYNNIKNPVPLYNLIKEEKGKVLSIEKVVVDHRVNLAGSLIEKEKIELLHYIIDSLRSEKQKEVIMMYYFKDMRKSDIAKSLGISKAAITKRIDYAEEIIKESVESFRELFWH